MLIDDIAQMIGKKVEVVAHEITYTGILMEVSEEEINLKGEYQWIGIPIENVVSIRPVSA